MTRLQAAAGDTDAYLAVATPSPGAPVLVLHAWWGLNDTFRDFVDRLAADGFTVMAPDLFDGRVLGSIEEAEAYRQELDEEKNADRLFGRVQATLETLLTLPEARGERAEVIGFSFGADYARWLAAVRREIAAVVTYYGGSWDMKRNPDVPLAAWLSHWAEADPYEDVSAVPPLQERLVREDPRSAAHIYEGTHHWFAEADRPEYNEAASELAYRRTVAFLRANLA